MEGEGRGSYEEGGAQHNHDSLRAQVLGNLKDLHM